MRQSVKSGEIVPADHSADEALAMMVEQPLLILRPLMDVDGELRAGFDAGEVDAWIGLNDSQPKDEPSAVCHRTEPCPAPEAVT
jgi:hypothetical protein